MPFLLSEWQRKVFKITPRVVRSKPGILTAVEVQIVTTSAKGHMALTKLQICGCI
jgi:hypothetical protein